MALAASEGARDEAGVRVRLLCASQARPEDVLSADGYVFAMPENLAAMAGLMKDFFDRCYYAALDRVNGRPYACWCVPAAMGRMPLGKWTASPPGGGCAPSLRH